MANYINLAGRRNGLPFSDAVKANDTLYLSGRLGLLPGTTQIPEKVEDEVELVLDGIRSVLESAGMAMSDLVYVQIFTPDVSLFEQFNAVYRRYFTGDLPARAFLGSGPLLYGARFEIVATAVKAAS